MSYRFTLPIYNVVSVKKRTPSLTVNWYRNAHYRQSNSAKKRFKSLIKEQIEQFDPIGCKVKINYTYYAASNTLTDLDNFTGAVKKFFQDALVECGFIPDDNTNYIVANSERFGGVDKENPRVEAEIIILD